MTPNHIDNNQTYGKWFTVACKNNLNVRSSASSESAIIGHVTNGDTVFVISSEKNWLKIEYGSGYGFVSSSFIQPLLKNISTADNSSTLQQSASLETKTNSEPFTPSKTASIGNNRLYTLDGKTYRCGDLTMTPNQCLTFLKENCPRAYDDYNNTFASADRMAMIGSGFALAGLLGLIGGIVSPICGAVWGWDNTTIGFTAASWTLVGVTAAIAIPLWSVSIFKERNAMNWAIDEYNNNCSYHTSPKAELQLNLQASQEGIGLALRF